jgi:hypothetical protein
MPSPPSNDPPAFGIKEVWADNLEEEMEKIRDLVDHYNHISMVITYD